MPYLQGSVLGKPVNMAFENAGFKFTAEMVEILGGVNSPLYNRFQALAVQAFLVARRNMRGIMSVVSPYFAFADTTLPAAVYARKCSRGRDSSACRGVEVPTNNKYKKNKQEELLQARFCPGLSESEAAKMFVRIINDARGHWTTYIYDYVQGIQRGIR